VGDALDAVRNREWFYRFDLPDGTATTPYIPDDVATIHDARWEMAQRTITATFGADLSAVTAADFACHQGWFTAKLLEAGVRSVVGSDIREQHIDDATLINDALGNDGRVRFQKYDVLEPSAYPLEGTFDLTLMFGLIYHLENPVGAIRVARRHTRRLCLVETQLAPTVRGVTDWGSYRYPHAIVGSFGIVDETPDVASGNREANVRTISLFPDRDGLVFLMRAVGFDRVEFVQPNDLNEQLASGKRAMVAGWIDSYAA
jgi:tRNA (mo5U34)-methyltransferase